MPETIVQQIKEFKNYLSEKRPVFILQTVPRNEDYDLVAIFRELGEQLSLVEYSEVRTCFLLTNYLITDEMFTAFIDALSIEKLPRHLYLGFGNTSLSEKSALLLADKLLKNDSCPPKLELKLSRNQLGPRGAAALIEAMGLSKCHTVKIDLGDTQLAFSNKAKNGMSFFSQLRNNDNLPAQKNAIINVDNGDRTIYLKTLVKVLTSGGCPPVLDIDLSNNGISDADCQQLIESLPFCKGQILNINLSANNITDQGLEAFTILFASEQSWPEDFTLNISLSENAITDEGVAKLIGALATNHYPKGLRFDFRECRGVTEQSYINLFVAMTPDRFSKPLDIDFGLSTIWDFRVFVKLIEVIVAGNYPRTLKINFSYFMGFCEVQAFPLLAAWEKGFGQGSESLKNCHFVDEHVKVRYLESPERNDPDKLIAQFELAFGPKPLVNDLESNSDSDNYFEIGNYSSYTLS